MLDLSLPGWAADAAPGGIVLFRFPVAGGSGIFMRRPCLVVDRKTVGGDDLLDIAYGTTAEGVRIIEDNTALLIYGDGVRRTRFVDRNTRAKGAGSKAPADRDDPRLGAHIFETEQKSVAQSAPQSEKPLLFNGEVAEAKAFTTRAGDIWA